MRHLDDIIPQEDTTSGPARSWHLFSSRPDSATPKKEFSQEEFSLRRRLLNWRTLLPLAIAITVLIFAGKKLDLHPDQIVAAIRTSNPWFFVLAFIIYYGSFPVRSLRWQVLLANVGFHRAHGDLPSYPKLTEILYISWFANTVVPAKLGDFYRAYLLKQAKGVSATRTYGTILAERILDLTVLLTLFIPAALVSLHQRMPAPLEFGLRITLILVGILIAFLFLLRLYHRQIGRIIPARLRPMYHQFQEGTLGSYKRMPRLLGLTVLVWLLESARFYIIALSLHIFGSMTLGSAAIAAIFIALGESLLTTVPATSGGVGVVEFGMLGMLLLFTSSRSTASAAIILDRVISLISIMVLGFLLFVIYSVWQSGNAAPEVHRLEPDVPTA